MRVKFNSLNRYEVPNMILCNPGSKYIDGKLTKVIGALSQTSDEEGVFNFNTTSTLNFRATKVPADGSIESEYALNVYKCLQNRRLIFVEDIGFFIITDTNAGYEDGVDYKDITATSCELEIQKKGLVFIQDGTYQFNELLEKIVAVLPKWTIAYVDEVLSHRYRTFEDVDTSLNTLGFMLENMQEAYECVFTFDIIHRTICVYDQNNYILKTDIHLTKDGLIDKLEVSENVDELYTALSVFGSDDLTISAVNPIGTTTIYNFDHYLDWMSEGLRNKVISWSNLVSSHFTDYYEKNVAYYDEFAKKLNCEEEIARLNSQLEIYQRCRDNIVAESSADKVDDYNDALASNNGKEITITDSIEEMLAEIDRYIAETHAAIDEQNETLSTTGSIVDELNEEISAIRDSVSIQNYFTAEEYDELYDYIFEGTYTDEYITTTDIMSTREKLDQMRELYLRAAKSLAIASAPDQEFTVDTEDFVFVKEFQRWSEQLEAGCLINVELDEGDIAELFLTSFTLNWEDKSLKLTFGNRFNKLDPQSLFNNVLGDIQKSSNTINYIKEIIYPVKSGKLDELEASISDSRLLSVSDILSSQDGEVSIGSNGYTGKKKLSDGTYRAEQLKITSNRIVFTEDAWKTCQVILGYLQHESENIYGVNAGTLIGEMILGDRLSILDEEGNSIFTVMDNKIDVASDKLRDEFDDKIKKLSVRIDGVELSLDQLGDKLTALIATVNAHDLKIGDVPNGKSLYSLVQDLQKTDSEHRAELDEMKASVDAIKAQLGIE